MIEHNSTFAAIDAFAEQNREAILRDITRPGRKTERRRRTCARRAVRPGAARRAG